MNKKKKNPLRAIKLEETRLKKLADTYLVESRHLPIQIYNRLHFTKPVNNKLVPSFSETFMYLIHEKHRHYIREPGTIERQFKEEFRKMNVYYHRQVKKDNYKSSNKFSRTPRLGISLKSKNFLKLYLEQICNDHCYHSLQQDLKHK
ncbi:hypothetical protein DFA_01950 [Cavenderia fasciculata]|uniref:Uncharacterized protein n=1 Tax=Cavenderia fasciculata TaxID=261658 RepID=F4PR03_CACFS|nr:uncharacterized protein DFA_01950 [Cavenderia fasciculata]EGG22060.1 hypothetical protein DFA_01950 [Cavenderia fasciculata]|eukprot:XP_004359911.1 hypothetical protein DFA_01950 [Cavenderia fasciculata]